MSATLCVSIHRAARDYQHAIDGAPDIGIKETYLLQRNPNFVNTLYICVNT